MLSRQLHELLPIDLEALDVGIFWLCRRPVHDACFRLISPLATRAAGGWTSRRGLMHYGTSAFLLHRGWAAPCARVLDKQVLPPQIKRPACFGKTDASPQLWPWCRWAEWRINQVSSLHLRESQRPAGSQSSSNHCPQYRWHFHPCLPVIAFKDFSRGEMRTRQYFSFHF